MRINLYLPDRDGKPLRKEATELALADGKSSFSDLVHHLLREYVQKQRRKAARREGSS